MPGTTCCRAKPGVRPHPRSEPVATASEDGVAEGDVVRYQTDADGLHRAVGWVGSSGNCTIRVVPVPAGPSGRSPSGGASAPLSVAFAAPAGADFAGIKTLPAQGQTEGWWHYEVGCGTDEWWTA
ncbi:DUF4265 domain-containing protein [Streptomyces sp. WAC06614]|nr:DUF4265 domain-containing protein [Streptomyces sp. WAC06614]